MNKDIKRSSEASQTDITGLNPGPLKYDNWQLHPHLIDPRLSRVNPFIMSEVMTTKHEGDVLYYKQWNFWVRAKAKADTRATEFFRDYEAPNANTTALLKDVGVPMGRLETEDQVWGRIGAVWDWYRNNVVYIPNVPDLSSVPGEWPSIADYANFYAGHKKIARGTCFSTAHIFVTILGRILPRSRVAIVEAHHTENGAPPTASHVFAAVYVGDRWFYLDPTAISSVFPDYARRHSVGVTGFTTVDYEHPFELIPVPRSEVTFVPHLPK